MKLTKERKIYAGLFVAAACALIGDQLFSGSQPVPASAVAAIVASAEPHKAAAPVIAASSPRSATLVGLAQKLRNLDHDQVLSASALSDPFQMPKGWDNASDSPADNRVATFSQRHHVSALMVSGARGGSAIIDGQPVRVGQSLDGFKLVEVSTKSAVFEWNKQVARLVLPDN
jgi:hypothetical protein